MLQSKVSSDVMSQRQQYVNSVTRFVKEKNEQLTEVLQRLGIGLEDLSEVEKKQICPYNKDHVVPEKSFKKHVKTCKLLSAGYQTDELPALLQDLDFCYENADSILRIDIDENVLNKIIWDHCVQNGQVYTGHRTMPVSHIDENINLTQEDRLAVYRHIVVKSHEAGKVIPVDRSDDLLTTDWGSLVKKGLLDEQNNKQYSSKLEQLAALRDLKRRRQSYRAKNVHITKKSYTEIIREVISNQMEILDPEGSNRAKSTTSTSNEALEYGKSEDRHADHHEQRSRNRDRDYRETHRDRLDSRESYRGYDDDGSRDRQRRKYQGSSEGQRGRDRSRERFRDREISRSSRSSRGSSRERRRNKDSPSSSRSREFNEGDELLLREIKRETIEDGDYESRGMKKQDEAQDDRVSEGEYDDEKAETYRKRSLSKSDSEGSVRKRSKHKSKHKKKHSKKHKKKD